jgi:hypothetical protein
MAFDRVGGEEQAGYKVMCPYIKETTWMSGSRVLSL